MLADIANETLLEDDDIFDSLGFVPLGEKIGGGLPYMALLIAKFSGAGPGRLRTDLRIA